jgi:hypothetical protein
MKQVRRARMAPNCSQKYTLSPFIGKTPHHHSFYNSKGSSETFGQHLVNFQSGNLKERDNLGDQGLKCILMKYYLSMWAGFIWLPIGSNGRLL